MQAIATALRDVLILDPKVHGDSRGFFMETYNRREFARLTGYDGVFVQDNHSRSAQGVLRGLHYQLRQTQAKLVRVIQGEIFDVAVDLRRHSPTCGKWFGVRLSQENRRELWIPAGFAHGFATLSANAEVIYKVTDYYAPDAERTIRWDDPDLAIQWPFDAAPELSSKDQAGIRFRDAELFP